MTRRPTLRVDHVGVLLEEDRKRRVSYFFLPMRSHLGEE